MPGRYRLELGEELLTETLLVLLGLAWIGVILPATVRARRATPLPATERFKQRLDLIAPRGGAGRWVVTPRSPEGLATVRLRKIQRRRRRLLAALLWCAVLSLPTAAVFGGRVWALHLGADLILCTYSLMLIEIKRRREERQTKVRAIESSRSARRHAEALFIPPQITEARR